MTGDQQLPLPRSRQGHGSRACYIRGCRVDLCVMANAAYQRHYRAGRRGTVAERKAGFRITRPIADRRKRNNGRNAVDQPHLHLVADPVTS